uniref:Uncharacterized protein n=1 Tax=Ciona savignyi TaxID=51511 RepID=H2ZGK9_CIOSA
EFTQPSYSARVQERAATGKARVESSTMMGMWWSPVTEGVRYSVLGGGSDFEVRPRLSGNFIFIDLWSGTLNSDREIQIRAMSSDQRSETQCTIHVHVVDANDFQPLFPPQPYSVSIGEDTPIGSTITVVTATDSDRDPDNTRFYYSLKGNTGNFAIHPTTGRVILTGEISRRAQKQHSMQITAIDRKAALSGTAYPKETKLTVDVKSVNAHAPKILVTQISMLQNPAAFTESGPNKITCATLKISDPDSGRHGDIAYTRIVKGDPERLFEVEPGVKRNEKRIVFSRVPPPINGVMNLTVEVSDNGLPPRSSRVSIQIQLYDRDSFIPKFKKDVFKMRVSEASPPHTQVGFVEVAGNPNSIRFALLSGNSRKTFKVHEKTGLITTRRRLNRSSKSRYSLTIAATNISLVLGDARNTTTVVIDVEDSNDHDPMFTETSYRVEMSESTPVGGLVIQIHAEDEDAGNNGSVFYTLLGNPDKFTIDPINGTITTTQTLDYDLMRTSYKLRVRASDRGTPFSRKSECFVFVTISNMNDNAPMFDESDCEILMSKSLTPGSPLVQLNPVDIDHDPVTCSLLSGNKDLFEIEDLTCLLTLRSNPGRLRIGTVYNLEIVATDGQLTSDVVFTNITISSMDGTTNKCGKTGRVERYEESLNLRLLSSNSGKNIAASSNVNRTSQIPNTHRPQVRPGAWSNIHIPEDTAVGTSVTKVQAFDRDHGFNGKLWFTITDGNSDSCFSIDTENGAVSVVKPLDRERTSSYNLTVSISDLGSPSKTSSARIFISVTDINDNAPYFGQTHYAFRLRENVRVGFVIQQNIWATDHDVGRNANITYSLSSAMGGEKFSINKTTGFIKVIEGLDRESTSEYRLTVTATDGGKIPLSSSALVLIDVTDVNDNPPRFHQSIFRIKVTEDLPVGTVVFRLQSSDPDSPENSVVRYSLTAGVSNRAHAGEPKFNVDPRTGYIRISAGLDYRLKTRYNITARARDSNYRVATCYIEVEVVPVNRNLNAPYFDLPEVKFDVLENAAIGVTVGIATAVDEDITQPENSSGYSIVDGTGLGIFNIDENTGILTTNRQLDRETERFYWLTVKATDRGAIPLSGTMFVLIEVGNVNDNAPLPSEPIYFASVNENTPTGSQVCRIEALDLDGDRDTISYSLSTNNTFFKINSSTGIITTKKRKLDREKLTFQDTTFEVVISDGGTPPLTSLAKVVVELTDENDNSPKFLPNIEYTLNIPARNRTRNPTEVARVVAHDRDTGRNSNIDYRIHGKGRFEINPKTGEITTEHAFKENMISVVKIIAMDNGNPPRQSKIQRLEIRWTAQPISSILAPKFVSSSIEDVLIFESRTFRSISSLFAQFKITSVHISAGNEDLMFHLNNEIGSLLVTGFPDAETKRKYNLTLLVTDGYNSDIANIVIRIGDLNDHRPEFEEPVYEGTVLENTPVGTRVMQVTAVDGDIDLDRNGNMIYRIWSSIHPSSQDLFRITSDGVIYTQGNLDREVQKEHIFIIEVDDQGSPSSLQSYCRVVITIGDVNEHPPRFTASRYSGHVTVGVADESVGPDDMASTSIVTVRASDQDMGENARIVYSILSGKFERNDDGRWRINSATGEVFSARRLTADSSQPALLTVQASDSARSPLHDTAEVAITVQQDYASPPKFEIEHTTVKLAENLAIGSYVATAKASAPSGVSYDISIVDDDEGTFSINPHSGVVSLAGALDREATSSYMLIVTSVSTEGTSASASITVDVQDVNDNRPEFEQLGYTGSVSESSGSSPSSSVVGMTGPLIVRASDGDSRDNGRIRYLIAGISDEINSRFSVDQYTGAIRTKAGMNLFDYELVQHYSFEVQASDIGNPALSSSQNAQVIINILQTDEAPPKFSKPHYNSILYTPTGNGAIVSQEVSAHYTDSSVQHNITYSITGGNIGSAFSINPKTGVVTVNSATLLQNEYALRLQASDGKRKSVSALTVSLRSLESELHFSRQRYEAEVMESSTEIAPVVVVSVVGMVLEDNIRFNILNPTPHFIIGVTSGIIETTGVAVDREATPSYEILVEAIDVNIQQSGSKTPRRGRCIVHVTINDCNDNDPQFVGIPYYASVQIDAPPQTAVKQIRAVDLDIGLNGEVRYSLSGRYSELFSVHPTSGNVTVKRTPADVLGSNNVNFNISVTATDMGTPSRIGKSLLHLSLVNRATPVFTQSFYDAIMVPEDAKAHTVITSSVQAASPDSSDVYYTIEGGDSLQQFDIDFVGGTITTLGNLDFEQRTNYRLQVRARDAASRAYSDVQVLIQVVDINDNDPIFIQTSYTKSLPENTRVGTEVVKVHAVDLDSGSFGAISYSIIQSPTSDGGQFLIDFDTGVIWTASNLDAETQQIMEFVVRATDGGSPAKYSDVTVTLSVEDVNDNPPEFEKVNYEFYISAEASYQSFIGKVTAIDPDSSETNLVYSIRQSENAVMEINPQSGIISLNHNNIGNNVKRIYGNISATDGLYTTSADVVVHVSYDDTSPTPLIFHQPTFNFSIEENQPTGTSVGFVSLFTRTSGKGDLIYSADIDPSIPFHIRENTGEIITLQSVDREALLLDAHAEAIITMNCRVTDEIGQVSHAVVNVKVLDVNDNPPVFTMSSYSAVLVVPDVQLYDEVLQVTALDPDYGVNGTIDYSIDQDLNIAKNFFKLDSDSGLLTIRQIPYQRGNVQVLNFFIRATDTGEVEQLNGLTAVSIYLTTHAESVPVFDRKIWEASIPEDRLTSNVCLSLNSRHYPKYIYIPILSNTTDLFPQDEFFYIDPVTGKISMNNHIDGDRWPVFNLTVLAFVKTTPELVTSAKVVVRITDVDDCVPKFVSEYYEASVTEELPGGQDVIRVHAVDLDRGNHDMTYSLEWEKGSTASNLFTIDSQTGQIRTLKPLDHEKDQDFELNVLAENGAEDRTTVYVKVIDINDSPPQFTKPQYSINIPESISVGQVTARFLRISDNDTTASADTHVYITSGDPHGKFKAIYNKGNQNKNILKPLDREEQGHYDLTIIATDGLHSATSVVSVEIGDINDNTPKCSQLWYEGRVSEDAPTHTLLLRVVSTDADISEAGRISYQLSGTGSNQFNLDPRTGELLTSSPLDREATSAYWLTAISMDGGDKQCSSKIHITIEDVNDNAPIFESASLRHSTRENTPVNSSLHRIVAFDPDQGLNGTISFQLRDDVNKQFSVEPRTGVLVLNKPLDRETVPSYQLEIVAIDDGAERMSSTATLHLQILDVNDNPPIFDQNQYSAAIPEDSQVGLIVVPVAAHSLDTGANAKLRYSIVHGNEHGKFVINQDSGEIRLIAHVDFESDQSYVLTVSASDRSSPLSTDCAVRIDIIDVNDNSPIFSSLSYQTDVSEDAEIGRVIISAKATDRDSGNAGNITYSFAPNQILPFAINSDTGEVRISDPGLDFETQKTFSIQIAATDKGAQPRSMSAILTVNINDVNDNRPAFIDSSNCTVFVHESSSNSVVHGIIGLNASDADGKTNGKPFKYRIAVGNTADLFYLDHHNVLKSRQPLRLSNDGTQSRNSQRLVHHLSLEVEDSGKPAPLVSIPLLLNIVVLKESQYAPVLTSHRVYISVFGDEFCGGQITQSLHATDRDLFDADRLRYSLATPDDFENFLIYPTSGAIISESPLQTGRHTISVRVSDGSRFNVAVVPVTVTEVTELALQNSVSISFQGIANKEQYLALYHSLFVDQLVVSVLPNGFDRHRDLIIISLQQHNDTIELLFSIKRPPPDTYSRSFYQSKRLKSSLETNRELIEEKMRIKVFKIDGTSCSIAQCIPTLEHYSKHNIPEPVTSVSWSLVTPKFTRQTQCVCPPGTVPPNCDPICSEPHNPCSVGLICTIDPNEPNGYRCASPSHTDSVMSFAGQSSVYRLSGQMRHKPFQANLRIRTFQSNATLLYASGNQDFVHLQTFGGLVKFSFDCGGGPQVIIRETQKINDGHWHDISVQPISERRSSPCAFQIIVDKIYSARLSASSGRQNLDLTSITLGEFPGLSRSKRSRGERNTHHVIETGFRGCIEDVEVNEVELINLTPTARISGIVMTSKKGVENSCPDGIVTMGACTTNPCLNGGSCTPVADGHHICECLTFVGDQCELLDPCGSQPCQNNGVCLTTGVVASCRCLPGFSGDYCQVAVSCRSLKQCQNGGSCTMDSRGHPSCSCLTGWSGKQCELNVNECLTPAGLKSCGRLENCFDYAGGYACNCT